MAKRRRINVPLAITLGAIVVVLAVGSGAYVYFRERDPEPYAQRAREAEERGDWDLALENYKRAFSYSRTREKRTEYGIRVGDLLWVRGQELGPRDTSMDFYNRILRFHRDSVEAQERLTRLWVYYTSVHPTDEKGWIAQKDQADTLIDMAPDRPYAYEAAGMACFHIQADRARNLTRALAHFNRLRELDPSNPLGYYYPALILSTRTERPDPEGPPYDPDQAEQLMGGFPPDAADAQKDRFRLYQVEYGLARMPAAPSTATAEQRRQQRLDHLEALRVELDGIKDLSAMGRAEQARLVDRALQFGSRELAERVVSGWTNDRAAVLAGLDNPPVPAETLERLSKDNPVSQDACVKMCQILLFRDPDSESAVVPTDRIKEWIDRGLNQPAADQIEKGLIGRLQQYQRYQLEMMDVRLLSDRAARTEAEAARAAQDRRNEALAAARQAWKEVDDELNRIAADHPGTMDERADWNMLAARVAMRLGEAGVAQRCAEKTLELLDRAPSHRFQSDRVEATMTLATAYRRMRQHGKVLELLNSQMARNPLLAAYAPARLEQARVLITLRQFPQAERVIESVLAEGSMRQHWTQARQLKAEFLAMSGKLAEAVDLWGQIEGQAGSAAQLYREGALAVRENRLADAQAKFRQALAQDKSSWAAANSLARLCMADKDRPDAEKRADADAILTAFLSDNPDHRGAELMLTDLREGPQARAALYQTMVHEAETDVQRELRLAGEAAAQRDKDAMVRHLRQAEKLADAGILPAVLDRAFTLSLTAEDTDGARQYLARLERDDVDGIGGLTYRARLLLAERDYPGAITALRDVLKVRQSDSVSRRLLAQSLLESRLGTPKEAEALLRQSLQENPLDAATWQVLVRLLYSVGRRQDAWSEAERGLEVLGRDGFLESVRLDRLAMTEPAKAIEVRLAVEKARPDDLINLQTLSRLYFAVKDPANGEAYAMKVAARARDVPEQGQLVVLAGAAEILRTNGSPDKGEKLLADFLAERPDSAETMVTLGGYLHSLGGRTDEAAALYERAVRTNPSLGVLMAAAEFYARSPEPDVEPDRQPHVRAIALLKQAEPLAPPAARPEVRRRLAALLIETGQLDEARQTVARFRADWPDDPNGDLLDGQLLMRQGQFDEAVAAFDRMIRAYPQNPLGYYHKGVALYRLNPTTNLPAAITHVRSALDRSPDLLAGQAAMDLAGFYVIQNDLTQAASIYRDLLGRNPDHHDARFRLIQVLDGLDRRNDVDAAVAEALRLFPQRVAYHLLAGQVAMRRQQWPAAEQHFRKARALQPAGEGPALGLGQTLLAQKKFQALADESARWIEDTGGTPSLYMQQAAAYENLKRTAEMLAALEKAVEASGLRPDLIGGIVNALSSNSSIGRDEAAKWLDGFVARHPDNVGPRVARAHYWAANYRFEDAVKDLKDLAAAVTEGPPAVNVRFNLATLYQVRRRYVEAAAAFEEVLQLSGGRPDPIVLNNYAYMLADNLRNPAKGVELAERAAALTGRTNASILDTLGWCYIRNGQASRGLEVLDEARKREDLAVIYLHMAHGYKALDHKENARRMAMEAVQRASSDSLSDQEIRASAQGLLNELR